MALLRENPYDSMDSNELLFEKACLTAIVKVRYNFSILRRGCAMSIEKLNGGRFMKKHFRFISLICVAAMMVMVLAACGGKDKTEEEGKEGGEAAASKTYVIASDTAFPPFEYLDTETNTYVGLDMELLDAIAKDQGFTYTMKNEGFEAATTAVQSGQADGVIAGMSINEKRMESYDFSDPYFKDGQILVVAKDSTIKGLEDLKGQVVAAKAGTEGLSYAESVKEEYGFTVQVYKDSPAMYTAVVNGTNTACFEDRSVVEWAIKSEDVALQTLGEAINPVGYGFAVKKGQNSELIEKFNAGLAALKESGEYDKILEKYGLSGEE